jgi:hypothetical protein
LLKITSIGLLYIRLKESLKEQPNEVREAILNGEIIENYPKDKFGHSCLIFGKSNQKILHVQCSVNPVWIITAYDPTSMADKWEVGYKKRKKT